MSNIHCFSCGRDTEIEEIPQKSGKPIKRCANCRSLHYKVLPESIPLPQPESLMVMAESENA